MSGLLADLRTIVGEANVLTDDDVVASYVTDWSGRWRGRAQAVVRPGSTEEVAAVVAACAAAGTPVLPQGGNTGLVGGSVPMSGEIVLSLRRMTAIRSVDPVGRLLHADAGATLGAGQRAAIESGLHLGIDLASRDSATLGGVVATNAGGLRVVRFGTTRTQLAGLEAVLADGSVVRRWTGLLKDNVGYDLPGLICGSEGTLAVITGVMLRLQSRPARGVTILGGTASLDDALATLAGLRNDGYTIEAAEYFLSAGMDLLERHLGLPEPFAERYPYYFLIEVSGPGDVAESLNTAGPRIGNATVDVSPAARLWRYREAQSEVVNTEAAALGMPTLRYDVSVPLHRLADLIDEVDRALPQVVAGASLVPFGHLAEGNVHVIVLGVPPERAAEVTDLVLGAVVDRGGSVSAEHGIGRAKRDWVARQRTPGDVSAMRAVKEALDPNGLLAPGVLF